MKLAVIFPGWGTPKKLYDTIQLEGYQKIFADFQWADYVEKIAGQEGVEEVLFVAWSMGTLTAIELMGRMKVDKAILISPTLRFTESQPEAVVKKMIKNIARDPEKTIEDFSRLNFLKEENYTKYIEEYKDNIDYDVEKLNRGLEYLLTKDITSINKIDDITPIIFIGTNDKIIKPESSDCAAEVFKKSEIHYLDAGHNLIFEMGRELNGFIRSYINDREENS